MTRRPAVSAREAWVVAFAAATALGLADALPLDLPERTAPGATPVLTELARSLLPWYGWAALAPVVTWLCARVPLGSRPVWRGTLVHLAAGCVLSAMKLVLLAPLTAWLYDWSAAGVTGWGGIRWLLEHRLLGNVIMYAFAATAATAAIARRQARERALAATRLEAELARAEVQLLRAQLEPHFLFNALNAVTAYVRVDPALAERMLGELSDLLRLVLRLSAVPDVSVAEEMALVERYAGIHRLRFGDAVAFRVDAPAEVTAARVPGVILQPLVENALRHASAGSAPGEVSVAARRDGGRLVMTVANTITNDAPAGGSGNGVGLANTRARLERLYGGDARLELRREGECTVAEVVLPFRVAPAGGAA
ncbi:MAG TPA: histidine kinase [Longimicrobium sp.]|nr:histidine kinase [Longimicrobium sp.]